MRALLLLLAGATAVLAGEPQADPATIHLPADAVLVVRFAAPDRLDAIGRDLEALGLPALDEPLGRGLLRSIDGTERLPIDRGRPFYLVVREGEPQWHFHPQEGSVAPEGLLRVGGAKTPPRGAPLPLLDSDVCLMVPVQEIVARHRGKLDEAVQGISGFEAMARQRGVPVPAGVVRLMQGIARRALGAILEMRDIHYALTWREGRLESEGWIRSLPDSAFAAWLARTAAHGAPTDLVGLLPKEAFWMVESGGLAASLDGDVAALLDEAFGAGAGDSLMLLLSPSYAMHDHLTGRSGGVIVVQGMMAMSMRSIHEIASDEGLAEAIAALDDERVNGLLNKLGIGLRVRIEKNAGKVDDTPFHRVSYQVADPQLMMFAGLMQTCFAVEGKYLLVVQSSYAESELRGLIGRVRNGERREHPHLLAMQRLMPDRHEGLSINVGALKPMLAFAGMFLPEAAQVVQAIPDQLYFSTALRVRDGHVHFRGDWPLREILEFTVKVFRDR